MTTQLRTERIGSTLVFTLDGPENRNALSSAICAAGVEALNAAESSPEVRSVVLTGAGSAFSSSAMNPSLSPGLRSTGSSGLQGDPLAQWIDALRLFPKPVLAAVEGAADGAACTLALACDLVVAACDAKFSPGTPDGALDEGMASLLRQVLSRQQVFEWLWLPQSHDAHELRTLGLINRVVEPGQALTTALALCQRLNEIPPDTLTAGKELMNSAPDQPASR